LRLGYLHPPPSPAPVVVQKDIGGLVSDYQAATAMYRRQNREVKLHECRSACTLALSLPNVCVYPSSVLKFHAAYHRDTRQIDAGVSAELFNAYPRAVRARLGYLMREYRSLSGRELIGLGVRDCTGGAGGTLIAKARMQPVQVATASARDAPMPPPRPLDLDPKRQTPDVRVAYAVMSVASDAEAAFVPSRSVLMAGAAPILPVALTPR
jgi:hypothetical protein